MTELRDSEAALPGRALPVVGRGPASSEQLPGAEAEGETPYKLHRRFDRIGRLVGDDGMQILFNSHVMVVGLGGVGSFAAESLVRSGVGKLTLIDFDRVCVTNTNRQLQALEGQIGALKVDVLAERLRLVNPQASIQPVAQFYSEPLADELLGAAPDYVVDAIDNITAKCHLLSECRRRGLPVVSCLGSAGRMDPTAVEVADLAEARVDPMGRVVRKILRQKYAFPRSGGLGIGAVFSTERAHEPVELHYDGGRGFRCVCPGGKNDVHSCEERRVIYGTASFVTGTFGLVCASVAVRSLVQR